MCACEHNLKHFFTSLLMERFTHEVEQVRFKLRLDQQMPLQPALGMDLQEQFVSMLQSMKMGNEMSDVLSPLCKQNPALNPFITNISQAL